MGAEDIEQSPRLHTKEIVRNKPLSIHTRILELVHFAPVMRVKNIHLILL